jgi:AhpD family alkylhydroperoxidase
MSMTIPHTRLSRESVWSLIPEARRHAVALSNVAEAALDGELIELVSLRCSQINGCAYCVQLHTASLREMGAAPAKATLVVTWEEAGIFSEREQAALAWAETVTRLAETHVPQAAYDAARAVFSDHELACLTAAIAAINVWNRFAVSFRFAPEID